MLIGNIFVKKAVKSTITKDMFKQKPKKKIKASNLNYLNEITMIKNFLKVV